MHEEAVYIDHVRSKVWSFIASYFMHMQQQVAIFAEGNKHARKVLKLAEHRYQATSSIFHPGNGTLFKTTQ